MASAGGRFGAQRQTELNACFMQKHLQPLIVVGVSPPKQHRPGGSLTFYSIKTWLDWKLRQCLPSVQSPGDAGVVLSDSWH